MNKYKSLANNQAIKQYRKVYLIKFSKSFCTLLGIVGGILGLLQFTNIISYSVSIFSIIFLLILVASLFYSALLTFQKMDEDPVTIDIQTVTGVENLNLTDELISSVKKLHGNNDHIDVVRLCSNLSRPLWISGKYSQRITMGAFYEDSASRINSYNDQICALIDDMGWTNAVIGNVRVAIDNIHKGITISEQYKNDYLSAKGYRHLGVIELRYKENHTTSISYFKKSLAFAKEIKLENKKNEMIAGITTNLSQAHLLNNEIDTAHNYAMQAKEMYTLLEDEIRLIKVDNQIARILITKRTKDALDEAKRILNNTLAQARRLARTDQIGKSLLNLGEIHIINDQKELAKSTLNEALKIFKYLNAANEINKTNELLAKINYSALIN